MDYRPPWDVYFGNLAKQVATRSTCNRKKVGAIIVKDRNILSTGYNGSIRGSKHCTEVGCLIENGHCVRTIHAEANAIIQSAKHGVKIDNSYIYVTASPCFNCFKLIANAGIKKIFYFEFYRDQRIMDFATELNIDLVDLSFIEKIAKISSDGSLTVDEKQLVEYYISSYDEFIKLLTRSCEDDIITSLKKNELILERENIIDRTTEFFKEKNNENKMHLIQDLKNLIHELEILINNKNDGPSRI